MALVYNCNEDIASAAFISGLQVTNSFYKYLVKNDITKMRDILIRAQKYIQIEEATRATFSRPLRQRLEADKPKPQFPQSKNMSPSTIRKPSRHAAEYSKESEAELDLISFWVPIDQIFNAIKDQPWAGV